MVITGGVNLTGTPYADRWNGLYTNLAYLKSNVLDPTGTATMSSTLTLPDASTLSADIQVDGFQSVRKVNAIHVYTIQLTIPAGEFA
jgi:phosphoribosylformylglycinamidine (FGAM) synthase PurS component